MQRKSVTTRLGLAAAVTALGIGSAFAGGDVLRSGDVSTIGQWYGRAGGPVGAERIEALSKFTAAGERVGISYDKDVAARTNMSRGEAGNSNIGITYDKDVAARTNMSRGEEPIKEVGVPAKPAN